MKVCYVCCEYPPALHGGIGSVVQNTARALVRKGHQVRVIGIYPPNETTPEYEEDAGVQVWRLRTSPQKLSWIPARYRLFKFVQEWSREGNIDVVEVPDWEGYASFWPRLEIPVVARLHGSLAYFGSEMSMPVKRMIFWLESRSFHRADYSSSCSRYTAEKTNQIFGRHPKPTAVVYNSVLLSNPANGVARQRNSVVFAGTLTRKKGVIQLIKAWPGVTSLNPDAELHIFGKDGGMDDGSPMQPYLQSLLPHEIRGTVHFHGHVSMAHLRAIYQKCRMAIFPSYAEAFAMAPMEAMAEGCPVICSNRSSGTELVRHGCDGLLVDPDNEGEIAESILQLLDDDSLAARLGCAGRETIRERFSSERVVNQLVDFYSQCMGCFHKSRSNN
ncbi:MAG: glycosyltransferase family 4 protein [Bryobacteraceae bacterium]